VLVAYAMPGETAVVAFTAGAFLASVPLGVRLGAWGGFTRVTWQSSLAYGLAGGVAALAVGEADAAALAAGAGVANGLVTALIVNGSLPFMESVFGMVTPTSLMRLSNRNHPLLRELEQKALGSYNHSIMVATLCERACRAIGADALLASTAALYHDIGKVRRPYFFVENQFGVGNPHDDLEPRVSAIIIQEHVTDGVEMARVHRLPPEIVEGIATHHGTTLVSYFHAKAQQRYGTEKVVEAEFRYKGRKPASREMAVLMLADCCEGATRSAAIDNRNLTHADLEEIVHRLVDERVADGQLDASALTFRDLALVRESLIETLVGVYHPRIAYPDPQVPDEPGVGPGVDAPGATVAAEAPPEPERAD
jgi:putative nucleotidyltransferase with HDIG domain